MRELYHNFIAFGIFSVSIVLTLIISSNIGITGNVIVGNLNVGNCSTVSIESVWDSIFDENHNGIIIIKENEINGNCNNYLAYKNNSDGELWVISGYIYNNSWANYEYFEEKRLLSYDDVSVLYINISDINNGFLSEFYIQPTIALKILFLYSTLGDPNNYDNITNWSSQSTTETDNTFKKLYLDNLLDGVSWDDYDNYFGATDNYENSTFSYTFFKNESISLNTYNKRIYDPSFIVEYSGTISNMNFLKNSDWNIAFNLSDYFNISSDVNISVDFGVNNSNGEWINYSKSGDEISFKPKANFTGTREFQLTAINPSETGDDVTSNEFNISISKYNREPIQIKDIEDIYLLNNETKTLNLSQYFNDSDGDNLIYNSSRTSTVIITINGNIATIKIGNNFEVYEKFNFDVSDGFGEINSNTIYVFEDNVNENIVLDILEEETPQEEPTSEETPQEEPTSEEIISENINSNKDSISNFLKNKINSKIIGIIIIGIIIIGIIFIIFIIIKLKKIPKSSYKPKPSIPIVNSSYSNIPVRNTKSNIPINQPIRSNRPTNFKR